MADRISALEAEKSALEARLPADKIEAKDTEATPGDPGTAQLRLELAEAIRSRGVADTRLRSAEQELENLRVKTKTDTRSLKQLDLEKTNLNTRLKDREHELREKKKLLEVGCARASEDWLLIRIRIPKMRSSLSIYNYRWRRVSATRSRKKTRSWLSGG